MADPKPRKPAVSLANLATCFEKCMNVFQPTPPTFNQGHLRIVKEHAENIPLPSNPSDFPVLNRKVMEEDIEWVNVRSLLRRTCRKLS
jgi:hypothetical protein